MTEANLLTITAGDQEVIDVSLQNLTDTQMAGATVKVTARWRTDSPTFVAQFTTASGVTINSGPSLTLVVPPAAFSWIKQRTGFVYDVEVTPTDGSGPFTVVSGRLIVNPGVS